MQAPASVRIDKWLWAARLYKSRSLAAQACNAGHVKIGGNRVKPSRDIRAGEELTHDWATTDDDDYSVGCKCGAPNCRKILTGKDWRRSELQQRYAGYFSAYLAEKIWNKR